MRRIWCVIVLLATAWPLLCAAQRTPVEGYTTDRLIIKFRQGSDAQAQIASASDRRIDRRQLARFSAHAGTSLAPRRAMSGNAQVLTLARRVSVADARALAARLATHPDVEFALPDLKRFAAATPNDGYFTGGLQKNLTGLNLPAAWDITTGDAGLVVAVLDTGVLAHPDLAGRTIAGYDFVTNPYAANDGGGRDASGADPGDWVGLDDVADVNSPFDSACLYAGLYESPSSWHGTHIAGIIGAVANNQSGIAGINWNSKILPVRVLGKCGGYDSDIIDGMRWAAGLSVPGVPVNPTPAKVLNMSLGGPGSCNAAYQAAVSEIVGLGKVIVAAAGNEGVDFTTVTPASCQGVIAVAAYNYANDRSFYSNYGTAASTNLFAAPGDNVYSTSDGGFRQPLNDGSFYNEYGTSGAAAHISGLVSLMLSANPALAPAEVLTLLRSASTPLGDWSGSGKPDALKAVGYASVYRGAAVTPVSIAISGPASVFEEQSASYSATVTWSDSSTSTAFPAWSMDAPSAGYAFIDSNGKLSGSAVNADSAATVQASFTMNGVTVTAGKTVMVLDNYAVALAIGGPDTVNLSDPAPAKFYLTLTLRNGRVLGGDLTGTTAEGVWSVSTGSISQAGIFAPAGLGPVTVSLADAGLTASKQIAVVGAPPSAPSFSLACNSDDTSGLTLDQVRYLDVGSSVDIVPLCDGKVLVADSAGKRIDLIDVRTSLIARSWSLANKPSRMLLAAGTAKLFVTFYGNGNGMASIDLAAPDTAPQYIAVPDYTAQLIDGDAGQVWVLHSPFNLFQGGVSLSRFSASTGALLQTHALPKPGNYMLYSRSQRILVTALALSGGGRVSYDVAPASFALTERESLTDAGGVLSSLSPDGTRLLLNGNDLDVRALTSNRGTWAGAGAGGFTADGKQLAANRIDSYDNDLVIYSTERHVALKTYAKPDNCPYWGYQATRFSPAGGFLFGYEQCGINGEYGRLFWIALKAEPTPDPLIFAAQTGVAPGAPATSNAAALAGFAGTASISVTGGEYSIDGQLFTALPGTVSAGQTVTVRAPAPAQAYATNAATLTVGATSAAFFVTTGSALAAQWWNQSCASEPDLGAHAVRFTDIDPSWDMIALCDGRLLLGNRKLNRIELFDVRAGAAIAAWPVNATPNVLRLVPGTATLLVVMSASSVARVDLDTGAVGYVPVGGRPFDVTPGEPGEMMVVSQAFPSINTMAGDTFSIHEIASSTQLARSPLPGGFTASLVRYDSVARIVLTGESYFSPARVARFNYSPATRALALLEYSLSAGDYAHDIVISPDRTRFVYPGEGGIPDLPEFNPQQLNQPPGKYLSGPWPRAAAFNGNGGKLLVGNEASLSFSNGIEVFDVATRALDRYWILAHCDAASGKMRRVRYSPSGGYAYALETCGSFNGDSARLHWVRTDAASTMPRPDPVSFVSKAGVPFNTSVESNEITITGLNGLQLPISVVNGTYRLLGGLSTPYNGFVKDGDRVRVQNLSWFAAGVTTTTILNIGGSTISFDVTTGAGGADTTPVPFSFYTLKGQPLETPLTSNTITVSGINAAAPISVTGGSYSIDGGAPTATPGTVLNGQSVALLMTTANSVSTTKAAVLSIGGASAAFTATTAAAPAYSIVVSVTGGGVVTSNPAGNSCATACVAAYAQGTNVTLSASPAANYTFMGWSGACTGTGDCTVTVDGARTVTAMFADTVAPSIVQNLGATPGPQRIALQWSAATDNIGVTLYKVYRNGVLVASVNAPATAYTDMGLTPFTSYQHTVAACDAGDLCSTQSAPATAIAGAPSFTPSLAGGWNLMGNSLGATIDIAATFGSQDNKVGSVSDSVTAVWKWNAASQVWQFHAPQLTAAGSAAYAASHGYEALSTVQPGEGYWVEAAIAISLPEQSGVAFTHDGASFAALPRFWNLITHGSIVTPSEFNVSVNPTVPPQGVVPTGNFTSLWLWEPALGKWLFYSPLLESQGGLAAVKAYANSHNFLHFQDLDRKLGVGAGFWVER